MRQILNVNISIVSRHKEIISDLLKMQQGKTLSLRFQMIVQHARNVYFINEKVCNCSFITKVVKDGNNEEE